MNVIELAGVVLIVTTIVTIVVSPFASSLAAAGQIGLMTAGVLLGIVMLLGAIRSRHR
jgi:hypothetical protein